MMHYKRRRRSLLRQVKSVILFIYFLRNKTLFQLPKLFSVSITCLSHYFSLQASPVLYVRRALLQVQNSKLDLASSSKIIIYFNLRYSRGERTDILQQVCRLLQTFMIMIITYYDSFLVSIDKLPFEKQLLPFLCLYFF